MTNKMLTDPNQCEHYRERRQAVATTRMQQVDYEFGESRMEPVPVVFVVCLDCGKTEEASL